MSKWFEKSYSRLLVDNHITEDNPSFMTKFDPANYVAMIKKAGVDSSMVYACDHNGNCYYPTKVGHIHGNINGRDIFGETITLLRKQGIDPIAYYTWVHHNHSALTHPRWRCEDFNGSQHSGRYWYCCPANPEYREFTKKQIAEILEYDIEGLFIDMTFWPGVCVCHACRKRYREQTGDRIPSVINWDNPAWVHFQRMREEWMTEFAAELTDFVKSEKSDLTVVHNCAPVLIGWFLGHNCNIYKTCDYTSGDFYGGKYQQRLGAKVMDAFSQNVPFEFMTSRCVTLRDHTSTKSKEQMVCSAATTLAHGGAYFFIDAINPDGTLNEDVYELLGKVSKEVRPFKEKLQSLKPKLIADTGLYFPMASFVNEQQNGMKMTDLCTSPSNMNMTTDIRTINEILGTSIILKKANIPYRIVTEADTDFSGLKSIIVNNALFISGREADRFREFVRDGGTVIATGMTSYYDLNGDTSGDFALKDCFGVSYTGSNTGRVNYLALDKSSGFIYCSHPAPLVKADSAKVLAKIAETCFDPDDWQHYASIHSNPPGPLSECAGLTVNTFGKGRCIYLYSSLLAIQQNAQQSFGEELFKKYIQSECACL